MITTPCFVINKDDLDNNVFSFQKALKEQWGNGILSYSVKTNSLPWLLEYLLKNNVRAEVVSSCEYQLVRKIGFSRDNIVFNGPVKGKEEFLDAFYNGAIINIDSLREIEWLEEISPSLSADRTVGVRVNFCIEDICKGDIGWEEDGTRFGFSYETGALETAIKRINAIPHIRVGGLHMHVVNLTRRVFVYQTLARTAAEIIQKYDLEVEYVDIGGGFFGGVPGKPTFDEYVSAIKAELVPTVDPEKTALIVEPGSAISASPVDFVVTVVDVKDTAKARMVTVDGSRCNIDPLLIKHNYFHHVETDAEVYHGKQIVCGFTCMDKDRMIEFTDYPELRTGDRIYFHKVGSYSMQMNPLFISFYPTVYLKDGEEYSVVRRAWTPDDFLIK